MKKKLMAHGIIYLLIAALCSIGVWYFSSEGLSKIKLSKNSGNSKRLNFYRVLQDKLNFIFYSYYTLKSIPVYPINEAGDKFNNEVFQLRKCKLSKLERYYFYYPVKKENSHQKLNTIVFFILNELEIDNSKIYTQIENDKELDLIYNIIENCQYAIDAFKSIWDNTPEGDPNKIINNFDITKITPEEIDSAKLRWHKTKKINTYVQEIENRIKLLNKEFEASLEIRVFREPQNPDTIGKYKYNVSEISPESIQIHATEKVNKHPHAITIATVKDYLVYFFKELRKRPEILEYYKKNPSSAIAYPEKVQFMVSTTGIVMVHIGFKREGFPEIQYFTLNEPYQYAIFGEDINSGIPAFLITQRHTVIDYVVIGQNKAYADYRVQIDSIGGAGRYGDRLIDVSPETDVTLLNCYFHFIRSGHYESLCQEYIYIIGSTDPSIISESAALDRIGHLCNVLKKRKP